MTARRLLAHVVGALLVLRAVTPAAALPQEKEVWRKVEAPGFVLFGNVTAGQLVEACRRLEGLRHVLTKATRGLSRQSPQPTYVYLFKSTESFAPYKLGEGGKPRCSTRSPGRSRTG